MQHVSDPKNFVGLREEYAALSGLRACAHTHTAVYTHAYVYIYIYIYIYLNRNMCARIYTPVHRLAWLGAWSDHTAQRIHAALLWRCRARCCQVDSQDCDIFDQLTTFSAPAHSPHEGVGLEGLGH